MVMPSPAERRSAVRRQGYAAESSIASHRHANASLTILLSGQYRESIAGRIGWHEPGTLLLCPADMPHAQQFGPRGAQKLLIVPDPALLDYLATVTAMESAPAIRSADVVRIGRQLAAELVLDDGFSAQVLEALLWQLVAQMGRDLSGLRRPAGALVERARREMAAREGNPVSIAQLSRSLDCHPATLTRAFRRELGCSPAEYQRQRRIDQAARLITETTMPLSEVAAASGFCDQAHLSRMFRRTLGCSPASLRRA